MTHLLLAGAGHAHLEILRRLSREPHAGLEVTLVSLGDRQFYSGMVPGFLAGIYREEEIAVPLGPLAQRAGVRFLQGHLTGIDPGRRAARVDDGTEIPYDLVSLNLGSLAAGTETPGVAEHAALIRPFARVVELQRRAIALARRSPANPCRAIVVGGGAAGVEIACALAAVLDRAGSPREVAILEAAEEILSGYARRFRRRAARVLARKQISVRTRTRVTAVRQDAVACDDASTLRSDLTVWLTGPASPPIFQESGLLTDERGFLLVDDTLRSVSDPRVFAVGDCATLAAHRDTPKAGVYAVRQAPVLWHNLRAALAGGTLRPYEPQASFLSLLNTCDGKALLRYKGLVSLSRWAWWLKDSIDRRFMGEYRVQGGNAK